MGCVLTGFMEKRYYQHRCRDMCLLGEDSMLFVYMRWRYTESQSLWRLNQHFVVLYHSGAPHPHPNKPFVQGLNVAWSPFPVVTNDFSVSCHGLYSRPSVQIYLKTDPYRVDVDPTRLQSTAGGSQLQLYLEAILPEFIQRSKTSYWL